MPDIQASTDTSPDGERYLDQRRVYAAAGAAQNTDPNPSSEDETCSAYDLTGVQYGIKKAMLPDWWLDKHMPESDEVDLEQLGRPTVRRSEQMIAAVDLTQLPDLLVFKDGKHYPRERVIAVYNEWADHIARNVKIVPVQEDSGGVEQTLEAGEVAETEAVPVKEGIGWSRRLLCMIVGLIAGKAYAVLFGITWDAVSVLCERVPTVQSLDAAIMLGSLPASVGIALLRSGLKLTRLGWKDWSRTRVVINLVVWLPGMLVGLCLLSVVFA